MKLTFSLLAIAYCAIAAPTSTFETSRHFRLKSRALDSQDSSLNKLLLEPYHIYPAFNYAVLSPRSVQTPGVIGYLNGTAAELAAEEGNLLFDYSNGSPPYGFVIDQINATYNPIEINAGNGTQGIFIDQGVIKYHNPISGGFYACNNTLLYGPAEQLFYKPKVIVTPAGCSDIELVVEYV